MENSLFHNVYNPDVLSCIANLSNDEVFMPPELANKIIDMPTKGYLDTYYNRHCDGKANWSVR